MWKNWLGDKARIIGIDLNPEAKKWVDTGFEIFNFCSMLEIDPDVPA